MKQLIHLDPDTSAVFLAKDEAQAKRLAHCEGLYHATWEYLERELRNKIKYDNDFVDAQAALEWARDKLYELLADEGVNLDDLIE